VNMALFKSSFKNDSGGGDGGSWFSRGTACMCTRSVLQRVAACCSVLQLIFLAVWRAFVFVECVAACCSALLQCVVAVRC